MRSYLNPGVEAFRESLNSEIYIDKTGLIALTNAVIHTKQKYMCVSRPRRFGKSTAAEMLAAYYDCCADSDPLFCNLSIAGKASYKENLNRYDVIKINMQTFLSNSNSINEMLETLQRRVLKELKSLYPEFVSEDNLSFAMSDVYACTGRTFVILIDEWDCLFRESVHDLQAQKKYLDFLRTWLKDQPFVALAYMTGILPIKKYGSHSALNMFSEYSMTDPGNLAEYFGFTEQEVMGLCKKYAMSFEETQAWYDGYRLPIYKDGRDQICSVYSPDSVVKAMLWHKFRNFWNKTETFEALKIYIQMDMDGLKQAVLEMLAGESIYIDTETFANDMTTFSTRDDVLTLLVHLGYLTYDSDSSEVSIPNKEVSRAYVSAIRTTEWSEVIRSVDHSKKLLDSLWNQDGEAVAAGIEQAHNEISVIEYNDENSLSCVVSLAFYFAREYYTIIRELPTGKGYADIIFIPRKAYADKPAVVIELKRNNSAGGALHQILERNYTEALKEYSGNLLLAGINYDPKTKKHTCRIEKQEKGHGSK